MEGLVIRCVGNQASILCSDGIERCGIIKGNLRIKGIRSTNPIAVGDRVELDLRADKGGEYPYYIESIYPRRNYIIRRSINLSKESHILAANIDVALLVCTLVPDTSTTFIDRFLATAEAYRVPAELVFNKIDLYPEEERKYLDELANLYQSIGYKCHFVSALRGMGLPRLIESLEGKISLLSGHSGVGKSTLINALIPGVDLRVGDVSEAHLTGMHTTTFSQMLPLPGRYGGYLIDTPGIKGFGTLEMNKENTSHYFPDIFAVGRECRFGNCTHIHEPGCAVLLALENGILALSRYNSYLSILEDENGGRYRPEY